MGTEHGLLSAPLLLSSIQRIVLANLSSCLLLQVPTRFMSVYWRRENSDKLASTELVSQVRWLTL